MEILVALCVGVITATGVYLMLRPRAFSVILGLIMLTYAVNLFLLAMGRLTVNQPPVLRENQVDYADPVPQALVLTAIVISFGMTALLVVLALRSYLESDSDDLDLIPDSDSSSVEGSS